MATLTAPVVGGKGNVELAADVFGHETHRQLLYEAVRAEMLARRQGTSQTKTRGQVAGGAAKPWRQKGTGRARAGTIRAAQFTGGGHAFARSPRSYSLKVNRKARKAALRGALSAHAARGTLAVLDASSFEEPSTRAAAAFLADWGQKLPVVLVAQPEEEALIKSFRNLERVLVLEPSELEVGAVVWARALVASEAALERVQEVAQ